MEVLVAAVFLAGCYTPTLRDCTVTCTSSVDCAGDQQCTGGFCASAGACTTQDMIIDAPSGDAPHLVTDAAIAHDAAPDAFAGVVLHVQVMGSGKIVIDGVGTCTMDCMYAVLPAPLTAHAMTTSVNHPFDKWTGETCMDAPSTCVFTPGPPTTTLQAKFK